jgi:hypothetical protein
VSEPSERIESERRVDRPPPEDVVPTRAGGRPWMDSVPPVLAEVWSLAGEVVAARAADLPADPPPNGQHRGDPGVRRDQVDGRPPVDLPDGRLHPDQQPPLSAVYVFWRARVRVATPRAVGRLTRVIDELAVYPKTVSPIWDWRPGDPTVGFGFWVDGPTSAAAAVMLAKRALDYALSQARVGTPAPPPGVSNVALAIELEDFPIVRLEGFEEGW